MLANDKNKLSAFKVRVEDVCFPGAGGRRKSPVGLVCPGLVGWWLNKNDAVSYPI